MSTKSLQASQKWLKSEEQKEAGKILKPPKVSIVRVKAQQAKKNILKKQKKMRFVAEPVERPSKRRKVETIEQKVIHTESFVMKLFDRSLDLSRYKDNTPLFPICRAWIKNQPRNFGIQSFREYRGLSKREDNSDTILIGLQNDQITKVYEMPAPRLTNMPRIPPTPPSQISQIENKEFNVETEKKAADPKETVSVVETKTTEEKMPEVRNEEVAKSAEEKEKTPEIEEQTKSAENEKIKSPKGKSPASGEKPKTVEETKEEILTEKEKVSEEKEKSTVENMEIEEADKKDEPEKMEIDDEIPKENSKEAKDDKEQSEKAETPNVPVEEGKTDEKSEPKTVADKIDAAIKNEEKQSLEISKIDSKNILLAKYLPKWKSVKTSWVSHTRQYREERYGENFRIIDTLFKLN